MPPSDPAPPPEPAIPDAPGALDGQVVVVTGAGRGIGRAIAGGLVAAGARVVATAARGLEEVEALATELGDERLLPMLADVTAAADCAQVVAAALGRWGRLDALVNNAARGMRLVSERFLSEPTPFWAVEPDTWRLLLDTNMTGAFLMAREAVAPMLAAGRGRIVNLSINHATARRAGFSPYGPSKAGLDAATAVWAADLAGTGVTCNALLPGGATRTGMIPDDAPAAVVARLLEPGVVVAPLLWLLSPAAVAVSGRRLDASRWEAGRPEGALEPA